MNELKEALKNAGFEGECDSVRKVIRDKETVIRVDINGKVVSIANQGFSVTNNIKFKDLEELNKICYCYLLKDLNFEAKKYSWEECVKEKGWYVDQLSRIVEQTQRDLEAESDKNLCRTKSQALSIEATTQLMQICAEINKDFEQEEKGSLIYPLYDSGISPIKSSSKFNQFGLNSYSAFEELKRTNTPLLLQYFEKQAK